MSEENTVNNANDNRDPISGEPGAHPLGTGLGAASVGYAGTAIGAAIGGPVGAVVGAAVGAIAGGLAGKAAGEAVNPTVEDEYWRTTYASRPYVEPDRQYDDYQPAYRTGYEGYNRYSSAGKTYDEIESELERDYERNRSGSSLGWEKAKHATRDAWNRVERAIPGDADRDGR